MFAVSTACRREFLAFLLCVPRRLCSPPFPYDAQAASMLGLPCTWGQSSALALASGRRRTSWLGSPVSVAMLLAESGFRDRPLRPKVHPVPHARGAAGLRQTTDGLSPIMGFSPKL